jgi:hypothetical protein
MAMIAITTSNSIKVKARRSNPEVCSTKAERENK